MIEFTMKPAETREQRTALFVLPNGTPLGHYRLSLPDPLLAYVQWHTGKEEIRASVSIADDGEPHLILPDRETFDRLKRVVNSYLPQAIT